MFFIGRNSSYVESKRYLFKAHNIALSMESLVATFAMRIIVMFCYDLYSLIQSSWSISLMIVIFLRARFEIIKNIYILVDSLEWFQRSFSPKLPKTNMKRKKGKKLTKKRGSTGI